MFYSSASKSILNNVVLSSGNGLMGMSPYRGMATLKDIQLRLKSIKNIEKITKSMKMIASTKLLRAQKAMEVGRVYGQSANNIYSFLRVGSEAGKAQSSGEGATESTKNNEAVPTLVIACSSDRGLCGAIHSSISKLVRKEAREKPETTSIIVLGDKAKPQIAREAKNKIVAHFNQVGRAIPTWTEACVIAEFILFRLPSQTSFQALKILYNAFRSVIAYDNTALMAYPEKLLSSSQGTSSYEVTDEAWRHYTQFLFSNQLYWGLIEGHASEMAAKRTAMENATKNAGEVISSLTMQYNRTRQAVITNELVDIITGASAL
jgi:F-type H+-transporting ATPase subunit gamma